MESVIFPGFQSRSLDPEYFCIGATGTPRQSVGFPEAKRDGIRYSYISFCAKSASISLIDFAVEIVTSQEYFW